MDDLTATRLCAEAMGEQCVIYAESIPFMLDNGSLYNPMHDDAQAMALVKRFGLSISTGTPDGDSWLVFKYAVDAAEYEHTTDLNRAIVYCVAAMKQAKK